MGQHCFVLQSITMTIKVADLEQDTQTLKIRVLPGKYVNTTSVKPHSFSPSIYLSTVIFFFFSQMVWVKILIKKFKISPLTDISKPVKMIVFIDHLHCES